MNAMKISSLVSIALCLSACSVVDNIQTSFSSYDNKVAQFEKGETKAIHNAVKVLGYSLTIITPKSANLAEHLVLGNRTYTFTEPGDMRRRFTYITEITPQKTDTVGSFSYTKTKCKKQAEKPWLTKGEYINSKTQCLMHRGDDFPVHGMVATYEGIYAVKHKKASDTHEIKMIKAQSVHTVTPNIWEGSIILDMDDMVTVKDFYNLFKRYKDDELTFKFKHHSPKELQAAIYRRARAMSTHERTYVDYVDSLSKGDSLYFNHELTLKDNDSMDGIVTFRFSAEPYKNNGSILTLTPTYYPSSRVLDNESHITINFAKQRAKILAMIKNINKE